MRNGRWLLAAVLVGLALRIVAAVDSSPSDDLTGWRWVAAVLTVGGDPYLETTRLNWPPLWLGWIELARRCAAGFGLSFDLTVRILPLLADGLLVLALGRLSLTAGWLYAVHPVPILVTGAQAQFDAIPTLLLFLTAGAVAERRPGWAGGLMGLAAGFKTWPLFAVPALAGALPGWGRRLRFVAIAALVPALLTLPVVILSPEGFARNVLAYRSEPGWWGLTAIGVLFPAGRSLAGWWAEVGMVATVLGLVGIGLVVLRRGIEPRRAGLMALLVFLVATPGFGPQYLLWVAPFAALERGALGWLWHVLAAGALLLEFVAVPRLNLDPALSVREVALIGNEVINWLRAPLWLASCAWLGQLLWRARSGTAPRTP